jgi:ribosomal protein L31
MNKIKYAVLFMALLILCAGAVSAGEMELVKNPTLEDLQGSWEGTSQTGGGSSDSTGMQTVSLLFSGAKVKYKSERTSFRMRATITGEEIKLTTARRTYSCKLNKASNPMILNCRFDVDASKRSHKAYSGTMRLEKKAEK